MQSELTMKYERSMLQEINTMKAKYDEAVEAMTIKLNTAENSCTQYFGAIKVIILNPLFYHQR